jgi:septum formation inhibitor-activating ATPase MinD
LKIFVTACSTSTKYRQSNIVEVCQYLVEVEQALTKSTNCSKLSVFGGSRTRSDKNLQIFDGGQYLVEVEQALIKIFKLLKADYQPSTI